MRRLVIAGVTGSIGAQALDVLSDLGDVEVVAVGAGSDIDGAVNAALRSGAKLCSVESGDVSTASISGVEVRRGGGAMATLIAELEPDLVLNAVVGFAGVAVSRAAVEAGADLALANKESLVAGGSVLMRAAAAAGIEIVPVDSEHAALAQLLAGEDPVEVEAVTLTASGGPFRGRTRQELEEISVDEALKHPTWQMGGKITIDSATLMNKGLEVIEAERLFGLSYDQINVVVHPQSIVHALVSFRDGIQTAHLGLPDMKAPIAWALASSSRLPLDLDRLNLASVGSLTFEAPDLETFPALGLAFEAGRTGGGAPAVLNAANEVAVDAFLRGAIPFVAISDVVSHSLDQNRGLPLDSWDDVDAADNNGRRTATDFIERLALEAGQ